MLREKDLQELIEFQSTHPVLSVYLNFDPSQTTTEKARLRARQMLKPFGDQAPDDVEAIHYYLEHQYDASGQGLALFSCQPEGLFQQIKLPIPVRNRARLLPKPYVKPLAALLDHYGHYGIAIVDKQGLRAFHFHLGELSEQEGTMGETVRHTKSGGGSQAAGRRGGTAGQTRYTEELVARNLRDSADFAASFFERNKVRRILIGGSEPITTHFIEMLPKRWQSLVLSTFPMDMNAGHSQVLEKARQAIDEAKEHQEQALINTVLTDAAKERGAVGLEDTLQSVYAGNVQTLVVQEGYRAPGFKCINCGFISAEVSDGCPFCGSSIEEIEDAVEMAVQKVLRDGGEVEIISPHPDLEQVGKIACSARYTP
jgi:peptide subunit release factor 1 (eRF1)